MIEKHHTIKLTRSRCRETCVFRCMCIEYGFPPSIDSVYLARKKSMIENDRILEEKVGQIERIG